MATRGAYGVRIDARYMLNYHHFDSYPGWLGKEICALIVRINVEKGWETFREKFLSVIPVYPGDVAPDEFVKKYWNPHEDRAPGKGTVEWYNLLQGFRGAKLLSAIYDRDIHHFPVANDFLLDSLCEYGYVINLDEMTLEYYRGLQRCPQPDNPHGTKPNMDGYYPCRLAATFPLAGVTPATYMDMSDDIA